MRKRNRKRRSRNLREDDELSKKWRAKEKKKGRVQINHLCAKRGLKNGVKNRLMQWPPNSTTRAAAEEQGGKGKGKREKSSHKK